MTELQRVEYEIEQLKARKLKAAKFAKLMNNREFKELILDEYLTQEPARLTTLLVKPQLHNVTVTQLMAISCFSDHLDTLRKTYADVDSSLTDAEEVRDQMLAEDMLDNEE